MNNLKINDSQPWIISKIGLSLKYTCIMYIYYLKKITEL